MHTDNLIIVSAFVYFSPSINWPTCNLLHKLIFRTANMKIRIVFSMQLNSHILFFSSFSLSPFLFSSAHRICHIREHIIVGWLSVSLQPVIWLAFSLLARVKIYWAARVYNVKMVQIRWIFPVHALQPSHSLTLSLMPKWAHSEFRSGGIRRCPIPKNKI